MWKYFIISGLLILGLMPLPAVAGTSADVVITATGFVVASPGNFTLTYVSDYEVGISWTKPLDVLSTMVRVAMGRIPQDREDGYLVYYGDGTGFTDTNVDITNPQVPYYRAWSQRIDGVWEEMGSSGEANFMSMSYLWIGLIALALGLSVIGITFRRPLFATLAAFGWVLCMVFAYYLTNIEVQLYQALQLFFLLCFLGMLVSAYIAVRQNQPVEKPPEPYSHTKHLRETIDRYRGMRRRF